MTNQDTNEFENLLDQIKNAKKCSESTPDKSQEKAEYRSSWITLMLKALVLTDNLTKVEKLSEFIPSKTGHVAKKIEERRRALT